MSAGTAAVAQADAEQALEASTRSLAALAARLAEAGESEKAALEAALQRQAAQRRDAQADLLAGDPGAVLRAALPSRLRAVLPEAAQDLVEHRLELAGELEVIYVDHRDPAQSGPDFTLKTELGERIALHFADRAPKARSGAQVIARGLFLGADGGESALVLDSGEGGLEVLQCCDGPAASAETAAALENTLGEQRTVVLLVNFQDDTSEPWTVDHAHDLVFGTVSDYFLEASHQQTWLAGDTYDWLTLDIASDTCRLLDVTGAAERAAAGAGIDLSLYDRQIFLAPENDCPFSGIATLGGSPSQTWINGAFVVKTIAHELGHNFGLYHSHGLNCGEVSLGESCSHLEYSDSTDTMGSPDTGHFNSFQKERLGWIDDVQEVAASGDYLIETFETYPGGGAKALRILREVDPVTGQRTWFYVTYRQAIGFDSFYDDRSYKLCRGDVTHGVMVHMGTEDAGEDSYLLHMKPQSCYVDQFGTLDWFDPGLAVGDSFTDNQSGITIAANGADGAQASVTVSLGQPVCVQANPVIQISPSESQWVAPGTPFDYQVSVVNHDSPACAQSGFDLVAGVPSGWQAAYAEPSLDLAPGESATTTLTVTSPSSAADGFYDVTAEAENAAAPSLSASTQASYVVETTVANTPPQANDDSVKTSSQTPVELDVLANDMDPDGDLLSLTQVGQGAKGAVSFTAEGLVVYTPNPKAKGGDSFGYTASDGMSSASATVSVSIGKGGGGGGGGSGGNGGGKGKGNKP